jgi:hypothetical protein
MALKRTTHTSPPGRNSWRVGRRGCRDEALGVTPGRTAPSADLGGSSNYSNENFED